MISDDGVKSLIEKGSFIHPALPFDHLDQPFPPKANVDGMAQRIDEVADLQISNEHLAAIAADLTIAPDARIVGHDRIVPLLPKLPMVMAAGVDVDFRDGDTQVTQEGVPKFHGDFVIVATKRKVAQHLKMRQVRSIAYQTEIVGAETGLQRTLVSTVGIVETASKTLHSAANKERGIVVHGDDVSVQNERKTELLETAAD